MSTRVLIDLSARNQAFYRSFQMALTNKGYMVSEYDTTDGTDRAYYVSSDKAERWLKKPVLSLLCWGCKEDDLVRGGCGWSCHTYVK